MNTAIVPGSLAQIAQRDGVSLAETFLNCDGIVLFDASGSMDAKDAPGGKTRYTSALEELKSLQANLPGKLAVIVFSTHPVFCPGGEPPFLGASTDLADALKYVAPADKIPGMRFFVISDGQPDDEEEALKIARDFKNRIDTIFCGPEEHPVGRDFLMRLAALKHGESVTAACTEQLAMKTATLLLSA